jgi:hypothetical protein
MRFPMDVPVVFWWQDEILQHQRGEGRIFDISELGVFVLTSLCPPVGAPVNLRISIAAVPDAPRSLRMQVDGRVLRVEQVRSGGPRDGFALLSDRAMLQECRKRTRAPSEENLANGNTPKE